MAPAGVSRDGRSRPESWITFAAGLVLLATVVFLVTTRESISEATLVTLLTFAAIFTSVPLPDILRPHHDEDEEDPKA